MFAFGDPLSEDTDIGPIANEAQFDKILSMVDRARQEGATIAAGGSRKNVPGFENGFFIEPTILENVSPVAEIWRKEVFGPVLCVQSFSCNEEAISLANDTDYGLAAGIWTTDEKFASEIASKIDAGTVYINHYRSVSAFAPVGGIKKSGYGRELGPNAIREFMQEKAIWKGKMAVLDPSPDSAFCGPCLTTRIDCPNREFWYILSKRCFLKGVASSFRELKMEDGKLNSNPIAPAGNFRGHAKLHVWSEKPDPLLAEVGGHAVW